MQPYFLHEHYMVLFIGNLSEHETDWLKEGQNMPEIKPKPKKVLIKRQKNVIEQYWNLSLNNIWTRNKFDQSIT